MEGFVQQNLGVIFSLSLNVLASCGTIFLNKFLYSSLGFNFGTTLTVLHFVVTFSLCALCAYFKYFEVKQLSLWKVLPISIAFCGYVVFNNISLLYNSVSFYQVTKIFCTPLIILIETNVYRKTTDNRVKLSLVPVCIGICITVVTDMSINFRGSVYAFLAVLSNTMYTIYGKTKQNELGCNAMQIRIYQAAQSAIILMFFVPFLDDMGKLLEFDFTKVTSLFWILFSCFAAFTVNFSFFLLVGKTSPLTVTVVGYFKTCIVFVGGWLMFDQNLTVQNTVGIVITLLGVALYTYVKYNVDLEEQKKKQTAPSSEKV